MVRKVIKKRPAQQKKGSKKPNRKESTRKSTLERDYGQVPIGICQYRPILNFNPHNPPLDYIIVRIDLKMLDQMRKGILQKGAIGAGVPCRQI